MALLIPFAVASYAVWYTYFVVHPYERVVHGASEGQVLASMGRPNRITGMPQNIAWDSDGSIRAN